MRLSFATTVAALVWANYATLDQVSRATGQIIPLGRVQIVQSVDGGRIQSIAIKEGDVVSQGQVLVALDHRQVQASLNDIKAKVAALRITNARIAAELFERDLVFTPDLELYSDFIDNQTRLYNRRRQSQASAVSALEHSVRIARDDFDLKQDLFERHLATQSEVLQIERVLADAEAALSARHDRYFEELQSEYAKNSEDLATAEQVLLQRETTLENTRIVAPVDGTIKNVRLTTVGGVLRPGDEVLEIVPTGDSLIVEAKLAPSEIGFVHVGQDASVKFEAYDSGIFGAAKGRVTYVSPDTLSEMKGGMDMPFYRVHLSVSTEGMHGTSATPLILQPGMTATVEIQGGSNTVLNYLLKPMTKTLAASFGER